MNLQFVNDGDFKRIINKEKKDTRKIIKYVMGFIAILSLFTLNPIIDIFTYGEAIFYDEFYHSMFFLSFMIYFAIIGMYLFVNYWYEPLILSYNSFTRELIDKEMRIIINKDAKLRIEEYKPKSSDHSNGWRVYLLQNKKKFQIFNKTGTKSDRKDIVNLFQELSDDLQLEFKVIKKPKESVSLSWEGTSSNSNDINELSEKLQIRPENRYRLNSNIHRNDFNLTVDANNIKLKINKEPISNKIMIFIWLFIYFTITSYVAMLMPGWLSAYNIKNNYDIVILIEIILLPIILILTYILFNYFKTTYNEVEITKDRIIFRKDGGVNREQILSIREIRNIKPIYLSEGIKLNIHLIDRKEIVHLPIKQKNWDIIDYIEKGIYTLNRQS